MRIPRNVASIPLRSAKETWQVIINLVTGEGSVDVGQLEAAASIMESLIADEQPAAVPIVIKGAGPRVRIYCLYDEDAMEAGLDIDGLKDNPMAGHWQMTAPSEDEDVDWMNKSLKARAPRVTVHAAGEAPAESDEEEASKSTAFDIDWGALTTS